MHKRKQFWLGLSLINLCPVALLGVLLRSKILFSIPFIDYHNFLSAHSHLAFSGWVGLAIITLLIYEVLPAAFFEKRLYQYILWGIEFSSLGMAVSFPFKGYALFSIVFSTLFIFTTYVFGWVFFKDLRKAEVKGPVRWLSLASIMSLMLSSVGPFSLAYIMISKSGNSLLYRDAIYTFLHLQYNGFFTLGIFALFFNHLQKGGIQLSKAAPFSGLLIASVIPSLFLSLLWHNLNLFYVLALLGCLLILLSLLFFMRVFRNVLSALTFQHTLAKIFLMASFISFTLKMLLTIGTIYPPLGNAVYGARPVIIGFLHLVFLGFVSFFILSKVMEEGAFHKLKKLVAYPFYIFGFGVLANEVLLMLQGLEILFKTNSPLYNWLLWIAAIILFLGALGMVKVYYAIKKLRFKP